MQEATAADNVQHHHVEVLGLNAHGFVVQDGVQAPEVHVLEGSESTRVEASETVAEAQSDRQGKTNATEQATNLHHKHRDASRLQDSTNDLGMEESSERTGDTVLTEGARDMCTMALEAGAARLREC